MKKIVFVIIVFLCNILIVNAQDFIVLRDATEIEAKVLTVESEEITYKKWDFQDGPTFHLSKQKIFYIRYSNGSKDVFDQENTPSRKNFSTNKQTNRALPKNSNNKSFFEMYAALGCSFFSDEDAGPSLHFTPGVRVNDHLFLGLKTGTDILFGYYNEHFDLAFIPFLLNVRGNYLVNTNFSPYAELSIGPVMAIDRYDNFLALGQFQVGLGMEWKRLVVGMGYQIYFNEYGGDHAGYLNLGIRLGKMK